jgi:type III secretion system YscD/HrpQ family protein
MAGYLIAEEGTLAGLIVRLEEGSEWVLGRDPDESSIVLEDPKVSRKHVICSLTSEGFLLENLSSVNPSTQNGKVITEAVLLHEGDVLQIGSTYFLFTEKNPTPQKKTDSPPKEKAEEKEVNAPEENPEPEIEDAEDKDLDDISFEMPKSSRWFLKVISGPNTGAEFSLHPSLSYTIGRDAELSDVIFQDLSVSRQHAKLEVSTDEKLFIQDMNTRNGVIINGELLTEKKELSSQDLIALGTTSFLVIDREQVSETIISPPSIPSFNPEEIEKEEEKKEKQHKQEEESKSWKDLVIPTKVIVLAAVFGIFLLIVISSTFSLFEGETLPPPKKTSTDSLKEALEPFSSVQFSYNESTGKLFLIGHVLTTIDKQELSYTLSGFPFIRSIEDSVIIDELAWQSMNELLLTNPHWQAVLMSSPKPGRFVLKGYVQTPEEGRLLSEYITANFAYPNLLENQVVIGNTLALRIQSMLIEQGFGSVIFNSDGGELLLSGRVDDHRENDFDSLVNHFQKIPGIRSVQSFVVFATEDTSRIDLSSEYTVTGLSTGDNNEQFVVINQKIFSKGDRLNGMMITEIEPNNILLEKDGIKFRINYNLQ